MKMTIKTMLNKDIPRSYFILFPITILVLVHIIIYANGLCPQWQRMGDVDSYMRLYQVLELHETGNWYDSIYKRSNAPYGELRQWTRPLDVLLYAGASLLALKLGFRSALFLWGWIIGPILHTIALISLFWAVRPFLSIKAYPYIGFLFIFQVGISSYFIVGNSDHHHILLLFFIFSVGYTIRLLIYSFSTGICLFAGVITAIFLWISTEAILPLFLTLLTLGLAWILGKRDYSLKGLLFSLSLFCTTAVALALERPWYDWTLLEVDRISLVHLGIFGIIMLLWLGIWTLDRAYYCQRFWRRVIVMINGLILAGLASWLCFPKFFRGPFADIDPVVWNLLLKNSLHMQPMTSLPNFLPTFMMLLGFAIILLPFTLYMLWLNRRGCYEQWMYLTLGLMIFLPVSLYQMRWVAYAEVLLVIPLAQLLSAVLNKQEHFLTGFWKPWGKAMVIIIFCTANLFLYPLLDFTSKKEGHPVLVEYVPISKVCDYLNEIFENEKPPKRILAFFFFGPEILYRTNLEVIGTPDHRNTRGICDSYRIMGAPSDEDALRLIRERRIDLILLCPATGEARLLSNSGQTLTFYRRLQQGEIPEWVQKINLPDYIQSSFLLFKVTYK